MEIHVLFESCTNTWASSFGVAIVTISMTGVKPLMYSSTSMASNPWVLKQIDSNTHSQTFFFPKHVSLLTQHFHRYFLDCGLKYRSTIPVVMMETRDGTTNQPMAVSSRLGNLCGVLNAQKRRCRNLWESTCSVEPAESLDPPVGAPTMSLEECLDREVPGWENSMGFSVFIGKGRSTSDLAGQ